MSKFWIYYQQTKTSDWLKKYLDKIIIFQQDYHLLIKRLKNYFSLAKTKYKSAEDMNNQLQQLKGITKLKFCKNAKYTNYNDNRDIRMDEDLFSKNGQSIGKIYHEVLLLMKFLKTKQQVNNMNINSYGLHYTVIKKKMEM